MYKIHLRKKRLESYLPNMYVLNLLKEPQHLAKIRTPKLLKIPNKGVTNLRDESSKTTALNSAKKKHRVHEKCPRQFPNVKVRIV